MRQMTIGSFHLAKDHWQLSLSEGPLAFMPFAGPWTDFALWRLSLCLLVVVALCLLVVAALQNLM